MARNEEKAQSMLYRFREAMAIEAGLIRPKNETRPRAVNSVSDLKDAEYWRQQVFKEISMKVSRIQNPGLNDYEIRELNDDINRLLKEKGRWEYRIKDLGGRNYMKSSRILDNQGRDISGTRGYKYFGRARDLPGVKEYLNSKEAALEGRGQHIEVKSRKTELLKNVSRDYYGDEDDLDGQLEKIEAEEEKSLWTAALNEWKSTLNSKKLLSTTSSDNHDDKNGSYSKEEEENNIEREINSISLDKIPSQVEVEAYLSQRRSEAYTQRAER